MSFFGSLLRAKEVAPEIEAEAEVEVSMDIAAKPIKGAQVTYAQQGEDMVLQRLLTRNFKLTGDYKGFYVDVGAHHPEVKSNTKKLYDAGYRGINIDMQKTAIDCFNQSRPDDVNIQCGVSDSAGKIISYINPKSLLGTATCDADNATKQKSKGQQLVEVEVPARTLTDILKEHARDRIIDYLNIDVEGFEMKVLRGLDFKRYQPRVISIEIHAKSMDAALKSDVAELLKTEGYKCMACNVITYFFIKP